MQPVDPYQLVEMLGSCPAGSVWSAVEPHGERITVAILDADAAADDRWRKAFSSAAEALADPAAGVPTFRYANFTARVPWVACGAGPGEGAERIFLALGQEYRPAYPPVPRFAPSEPPRGRVPRPLLAGAAVVAVLLAGAAAVIWWPDRSAESPPRSGASATPSRAVDTPPGDIQQGGTPPLATPNQPGLEPPAESSWRTDWPQFTPADTVRTYTDLADVGLVLKVPWSWDCSPVPDDRDPQTRRLRCSGTFGEQQQVGGEVVVRPCPHRCTPDRQATMRQAEEAWSQQWLQPGIATVYAEISTLQVDGERRHGLVMVAYWRGGQDGSIDRQLVLRLTGPADGASPLRMIANYLRSSLLL
ncbi:hypothetical protein [Micromonospora sp. LOL_021]|uniref:hypothetical protein n=1 Tax=Micromonospora sp. LOL_021 TaxID=3345417 RepID=UPI003A8B787B